MYQSFDGPLHVESCIEKTRPSSCQITSVILSNYRNYPHLHLQPEGNTVVITGPNGSGKTNILEALSFFAAGRGLRRAKLSHILYRNSASKNWGVFLTLVDPYVEVKLGTGVEHEDGESRDQRETSSTKRVVKINHTFSSQSKLTEWISVVWQTPQMDKVFQENMGLRRKFLDRMVAGLFPEHTKHLYQFDHAVSERTKVLLESGDKKWLALLEKNIAEACLAIHSLRSLFLEEIHLLIQKRASSFPKTHLVLEGKMEEWIQNFPALEVENRILEHLEKTRAQDRMEGGVALGPHKTQLKFIFENSDMEAIQCSTGEQKAILLGITFALCRLHQKVFQRSPILLLDEVGAHLDENRRQALFLEIRDLGVQTWLTGADQNVFLPFIQTAQHFCIQQDHGYPSLVKQSLIIS